jgi:hypothetical protein
MSDNLRIFQVEKCDDGDYEAKVSLFGHPTFLLQAIREADGTYRSVIRLFPCYPKQQAEVVSLYNVKPQTAQEAMDRNALIVLPALFDLLKSELGA